MTVDELTQRTLYRRDDWQRVHTFAMLLPNGAELWDGICRQAISNSMVGPGMALTMLRMIEVPMPTGEEFARLAKTSPFVRARRRRMIIRVVVFLVLVALGWALGEWVVW